MTTSLTLDIRDLWVFFNGQPALESISLEANRSELISVVGPNGGGKTTLLKAILGLIPFNRGEVRVLGKPAGSTALHGRIGYLPQGGEYDRYLPLRARDVVAMTRYARMGWREKLVAVDRERIDSALISVDMKDFGHSPFGTLSGGQRQRVLIARALAMDPPMMILDEPSTGLDTVAQDSFYELLHRLKVEKGLTILLVSHDIGGVSSYADRIACLNRKIHFHGRPQDCRDRDMLAQVFGRDIHFLLHDEKCLTCREKS